MKFNFKISSKISILLTAVILFSGCAHQANNVAKQDRTANRQVAQASAASGTDVGNRGDQPENVDTPHTLPCTVVKGPIFNSNITLHEPITMNVSGVQYDDRKAYNHPGAGAALGIIDVYSIYVNVTGATGSCLTFKPKFTNQVGTDLRTRFETDDGQQALFFEKKHSGKYVGGLFVVVADDEMNEVQYNIECKY